jgi:NAD(P)H-dependent FMN reductase
MWRNGRRNGLKIRWAVKGPCRFESGHRQFSIADIGLRIAERQAEIGVRKRFDMSATTQRPLFLPVILGTARQGRQSENVARFVFEEAEKRADVETEVIDVRTLPMRLDDAGEHMKDAAFSATIQRCDGIILVVPEYNHGYPGLLKHALDMNLKEYIHKAVGICGVSAGPFGGARVIEALLPVMRELGLVTIFEDVNFGKVQELFDEQGKLLDQSYVRRMDKFLNELIWMARVLRDGREKIAPA